MTLRTIIVFLLIQICAVAHEDGVYEATKEGPGKRVELKITRGQILSLSNTNDKWQLFVCYSPDGFLEGDKYAVVLDGKVFKINSWGKSGDKENDFSLELDNKYVGAAKKLFGFVPIERKHNGYKVNVKFEPDKESYEPGEKITVKMTITNVSDKPFYFRVGGHQRGPRDDQFSFSCDGPDGAVLIKDAMNFGGMSSIKEIEPGKTFEDKVSLDDWMELRKPGIYTVRGSYLVKVYDEKNTRAFETWVDHLTQQFHLEIKQSKKAGK